MVSVQDTNRKYSCVKQKIKVKPHAECLIVDVVIIFQKRIKMLMQRLVNRVATLYWVNQNHVNILDAEHQQKENDSVANMRAIFIERKNQLAKFVIVM